MRVQREPKRQKRERRTEKDKERKHIEMGGRGTQRNSDFRNERKTR
jgi:hypothetical protein